MLRWLSEVDILGMFKAQAQLSADDVLHLAKLARLELSPTEVKKFSGELSSILDYLAKLQELPPVAAADNSGVSALLRDDVVTVTPGAAELISSSPQPAGALLSVPKILGE